MRIEVLDGGELVAVVNSTNNIPAIESEFSAVAEIIRGSGLPPSADGIAENTLYFRIGTSPTAVIGQWLLVDGAWLPVALGSSSSPDTTAPVVTAFVVPATATSLTVSVTTFTATDAVGVSGYLITESATVPALNNAGWSSTAPTQFTCAGEGARTLYAWARDAAGNVSASASDSVTITLPDVTAPTVTAFVIPATSESLTVPVTTFTATDAVGVTGYLITESATTPALDNPGWSGTPQTQFVFSTEGAKTLYAWARDAAGLISASASDGVTVALPVPSFTATPAATIRAGYDGASIALAGDNTVWGPETPFTVNIGTIVSVTRTNATTVTIIFNAPITAATVTVSDGTTTAQFSVAAAVAVVTDWADLDLQLVAIGSSAQATVATPSSDEAAQIFATASGCPAERFFLRAANGNSIDGMTSQITAAIAAEEITDRSIVTVDVGTIVNTAYGTPTVVADPVQCAALVATWGIQVDRILATGARVLILEAPSLNYVHASDGGAELRTQTLLWMAAHDPPLSSATDYTPVHGLTGSSATYYIEQDNPAGPHLNETGANLITPILTYRLSRIAADIGYAVTMTATPAAPVVANTSDNVINLAGSHTAWAPGTTFSITSGGGTITATTITDADTAQVTYTSVGAGTVTISDGTTTATFTVESATSVLWADPFDGSGALDAGWLAGNGATGVRDAGSLRRTDVGDFRTLYNLAGGALPAQYSVRWTVAPSFVAGTGYRGLLGYVTGNGTGRGVFWPGTSRNNFSYNEGTFGSSVAFTHVADPPASWALDNQDHTIELRFTTNLVSLYLDDTLVGTHSAGADATATGVGTIGDGQYDQVTNYFVVRGVEVLSI